MRRDEFGRFIEEMTGKDIYHYSLQYGGAMVENTVANGLRRDLIEAMILNTKRKWEHDSSPSNP
jgi:coenzyme F420-reducing hydrogenase beta subunit